MKILHVVHLFLPRHRAGVEVYTDLLTAELAKRHDVSIYTTEHEPGAESYALRQARRGDVDVHEVVNNKSYDRIEETWDNPAMERRFEEILDRVQPDVVHVQHLMFHSLGYVRIAKARGIPVVFTLHEYWLICLRGGQMILPDLTRCELPTAEECARCAALGFGQASGLERIGDRVVRTVRRFTRINLWPLLRAARIRSPYVVKRWLGMAAPSKPPELPVPTPEHVRQVEARRAAVRAMMDQVDRFVAPSRFLHDMFVRFGVPDGRILHSDYGFDVTRFSRDGDKKSRDVSAKRPLRFGVVGSLIPVKGIHVAVEAFEGMDPARAELVIHGTSGHRPDYVQQLRRRAEGSPIRFAGAFDNERIADVLGSLDALIVPSVWYENSPLTIHEGFLAGIPVIVSDLGGMRDLVEPDEGGLRFRVGDAADLRRVVDRLVDDRESLRELSERRVAVKTVEEDARELEALYARFAVPKEARA